MLPDPVCPRCGERLPSGAPDCPYCAGRATIPIHHRVPLIIAGVIILVAALWILTTYVTRAYAARQQQLAQQWFERGDADRRSGRLESASQELRTALAYSHDNFQYRLRLAEALAGEGHVTEARAYLLALWEEEPGNGTVNLELARLAARDNDVAGAQRFYHGAVYGVWQDVPVVRRSAARLELVDFLLAHNQNQQAQSELIAVAAELPRDPASMLQVANLMVRARDARRAFDIYRQVTMLAPMDAEALAGAGKAAFSLQMYPEARDYLRRAIAEHTQDPQAATQLNTAELVLDLDPYQLRLSAGERNRRVFNAFARAGDRLQECAATHGIALAQPTGNNSLPGDYANWMKLKPGMKPRSLRRNPEPGDAAMDLVFRIERDTAQLCGPGSPADQALLLIAGRRERSTP